MKPSESRLSELRTSGYTLRSPKDEMRANCIRKLRSRETLFPGIIGFDETVIPQVVNALLAKHDILLLGLRGQAKTRIARLLVNFLDEYTPIVKGSEINDSPFHPVSHFARELVAQAGDDTPIEWIHRSERYGEKLATPDVSVADLIGDIDPIKAAAQRLSYAHEGAIHYGIVPRTNRGIFVINELPDLQPRIQVALFNILQERDVQIRGFNVRLPLDMVLVFTANPEDYTNRGSIITPLKDRIDAQIVTHYPRSLDEGITIIEQNAWVERDTVSVHVPRFMKQIVEAIALCARSSEFVDQSSGVSARMTIAVMESLISNAERRAILNNEERVVPRVIDFQTAISGLTGKVELVFEGEQEGATKVARALIGRAVREVFSMHFPDPLKKPKRKHVDTHLDTYAPIVKYFADGHSITLSDNLSTGDYLDELDKVPGLRDLAVAHLGCDESDKALLASAMEFIIDALHQNSKIAKDEIEGVVAYKDMVNSIFRGGAVDDYDV